jgi:hypothetical protein
MQITCRTAFASSVFSPSISKRLRVAATAFASLISSSPACNFFTSAAFVVALKMGLDDKERSFAFLLLFLMEKAHELSQLDVKRKQFLVDTFFSSRVEKLINYCYSLVRC